MAQPDAELSHTKMPYEMNRGAEKHKNLNLTVPSCSISVLKNMAIFGGLHSRSLSTLARGAQECHHTRLFLRSPGSRTERRGFLSLRIEPRIV